MNKASDEQEPLLTAVARKLGQAAGTLANMTHLLTPDPDLKPSDSSLEPESDAKQPSRKKAQNAGATAPTLKTRARQAVAKKGAANARSANTNSSKKKTSRRKK